MYYKPSCAFLLACAELTRNNYVDVLVLTDIKVCLKTIHSETHLSSHKTRFGTLCSTLRRVLETFVKIMCTHMSAYPTLHVFHTFSNPVLRE